MASDGARGRRILVIRPDRIGDVALATPVIRALRLHFPDAYLAALVRPSSEPVLRHNPRLDTVLTDDPGGEDAGRAGFRNRVRMLRSHRFDTALMLLPTERHAWMTLLAGIPTRIGVGTKLYQILTGARSVSRHKYVPLRHEADYCMDLARRIGVSSADLSLEVFVTDDERHDARAALAAAGRRDGAPLITLHPESGRSAPNWPPELYLALARRLRDERPDSDVAILFSPAQERLRMQAGDLASVGVLLPPPGDLRRVMAIIAASSLTVSASTGPMHLAAGLRIPTVNLFCPLTACSPALWGPQGNRSELLLPSAAYCRSHCPGDPHVCTYADGGITLDDVLRAIGRLLPAPASA